MAYSKLIKQLKTAVAKAIFIAKVSKNPAMAKKLVANSKKYSKLHKKGITSSQDSSYTDYSIKYNKVSKTIFLRTYKGDINIFYEIFFKKAYNLPPSFNKNINTIIDLGAHVGMSTIYFSCLYPQAKILSLEPSPENFKMLEKNTISDSNIAVYEAAIHPTCETVLFDIESTPYNHGISNSGVTVRCMSMQDLISKHQITTIDLLKIDIEGAEEALLSQNNEWLKSVRNILIEVHEPYNVQHLKADLEPFGFKVIEPSKSRSLNNILAYREIN